MVKNLIFVFAISFLQSSYAQNNSSLPEGFVIASKPVLCGPAETILKNLASEEINEKPLWIGTVENGTLIATFVNSKTKAFTVIQFGDHIACVLAIGNKSNTVSLTL